MKIIFLLVKPFLWQIAFIIVNSFGLTAVRSNETIQPIDLQHPVDVKSSDRAFRSFRSIVKQYDCLSESATTSFDRIYIDQIDCPKIDSTSSVK